MYASTHADVKPTAEELDAERKKLEAALDVFKLHMRGELLCKLDAGWRGWDDPANAQEIYQALLAHAAGVPLAKRQEVAIANFAMFLWYQRVKSTMAAAMEVPAVERATR